jgi:methylenetetrahydrofolate reductase (NADPH)
VAAVSRLADALTQGRFIVTAEMPVIDGGGVAEVRNQLGFMQTYLDAVNATDNAAAHAHASPLAVAIAIRASGVEPVMQLVCRDRNRLALEADIVGASMHGIENISCLTGDDVTAGDEPQARRVFDVDSIQLVQIARSISRGEYLSGRPITPAPTLCIGAVENPGAPPADYRARRALIKARAGARYLQLQICFAHDRLERFVAHAVDVGVTDHAALLPSILIVRSAAALRFVNANVPGIHVPDALIDRAERSPDQLAACEDIAVELAERAMALPGVSGLHLVSFRRDAGIAKVCQRLGIPTREERQFVEHRSSLPV